MRSLEIAGNHGPIGVRVAGDGPLLVLLAGLGATGKVWGQLHRHLARSFTVAAPDNRGVGASRKGRPFTLDAASDDVVNVVQGLGFTTASLLGASLGGTIALTTALRHNDAVDRLVVASCAPSLSGHARRLLRVFQDSFTHLDCAIAGRALMTLAFAPPFIERFRVFVDEAIALYGPAEEDRAGTLRQLEHLLEGWDFRNELLELNTPTLVIAGKRDPIVAEEESAEIAKLIPSAEYLVFPDAAHAVLAEGGPAIIERLGRFLSSS